MDRPRTPYEPKPETPLFQANSDAIDVTFRIPVPQIVLARRADPPESLGARCAGKVARFAAAWGPGLQMSFVMRLSDTRPFQVRPDDLVRFVEVRLHAEPIRVALLMRPAPITFAHDVFAHLLITDTLGMQEKRLAVSEDLTAGKLRAGAYADRIAALQSEIVAHVDTLVSHIITHHPRFFPVE